MTTNVSGVIDRVLVAEGGVADVGDGKGTTYYGQTIDWLATFSLPVPDSPESAKLNYALWLKKVGLDAVCDADYQLGAAVVDWAVHSGHVVAVKALQRALNVTADGRVGPDTRHALFSCTPAGLKRALVAVYAERLQFLGRAITNNRELSIYAAGWMNRMATNLRADLP